MWIHLDNLITSCTLRLSLPRTSLLSLLVAFSHSNYLRIASITDFCLLLLPFLSVLTRLLNCPLSSLYLLSMPISVCLSSSSCSPYLSSALQSFPPLDSFTLLSYPLLISRILSSPILCCPILSSTYFTSPYLTSPLLSVDADQRCVGWLQSSQHSHVCVHQGAAVGHGAETLRSGTVQYNTVQHNTLQYNTKAQYSAAQCKYNTIKNSTMPYSTIQHCTALHCIVQWILRGVAAWEF